MADRLVRETTNEIVFGSQTETLGIRATIFIEYKPL